MTLNRLASRPEVGPLQRVPALRLKTPRPDSEPAMAVSHETSTCPNRNAGDATSSQRWNGEWSGDQLTRIESHGEDTCIDQTGAVCPKFAEARARQMLAELQLTEFNHRLANVLQRLAARIDRQRRTTDDPVKRDELESLVEGVHASAQLHRYLLPSRTRTRVNLGTLLEKLAIAIGGVTGLFCFVEVGSVYVPGQVAVHLAATVNELAWNAHKHAYGGAEGGKIRIACQHDADGRLRLSVADQGCGLPANFDPRGGEGLGLAVVCATVRRFGGSLRVESDGGARFTLLLDIQGA